MKIRPTCEVEAQQVQEEGAKGVTVRWLINRSEGAPNFAMRLFEVAVGGYTPKHQHAWEHEVYVLEGNLEIVTEEGPKAVKSGDAVLVLPEELHQFRNAGEVTARFLCMIPVQGN
jgi:quercetin dioxygenase-like cupin family protein